MNENEILGFDPTELIVLNPEEENTYNNYTNYDEGLYNSITNQRLLDELKNKHPEWPEDRINEYYKAYIDYPYCGENCLEMWLDDSKYFNGDGDQDCTLRIGMNTGCDCGDVVVYKDKSILERIMGNKEMKLLWGSGTRSIMNDNEKLIGNKYSDDKYDGNIYLQTRGNWEINELICNFEKILRQLKYIRKYGKH